MQAEGRGKKAGGEVKRRGGGRKAGRGGQAGDERGRGEERGRGGGGRSGQQRGAGGGGRGGGRRHRRVMRFLQPCLLTMLERSEAHGYNLLNGLDEFGFDPDQLDPSLVYRALREMEADGLVSSQWGDESLGPQRRVYRITDDGERALDLWVEDLRQTRKEIDLLLTAGQRNMQSEG